MFDIEKIKSKLKINYNILQCEETKSTNDDLASLARNGEQSRTILIAARQINGKGRGSHSFFSYDGGLYMSLLYTKTDYTSVNTVTALASCAVCQAIEKISGKNAQIKWINDIFIDGKKVCGILSRSEFYREKSENEWVIVGIGINVVKPKNGFPDDIKDTAGYIFDDFFDYETLIAEIANNLYGYISEKNENAIEYYRSHCLTLNKKVTVKSPLGDYFAFALCVENDYSLRCLKDDGDIVFLNSGEVSVKTD